MNKKQIKCAVMALLLTGSAFAQGQKATTTVVEESNKYKVETNGFWSNWFIGAGVGGQIFFGDHSRQLDLKNRITPSFNINVGKWFTPGIGVRGGFNGFQLKSATQGPHSTNKPLTEKPWSGYWLTYSKFNYYHINGDVMFNLTNLFLGYKENRFYNFVPYVGLGLMWTRDTPTQNEISANLGIYNTFRLSKALDLTLDVRGAMVHDRFDGAEGEANQDGVLSASIGLAYKFNKRGWDRSSTKTITYYNEDELNALRKKYDLLNRQNSDLNSKLADCVSKESTKVVETVAAANVSVAPMLVIFPINKSILTGDSRVNIGFFSEVIKKSDPRIVYTITGYADKSTGSAKRNLQLSQERAQAVYDALVKEFGVSPSQLKMSYDGGVDNMFYNDPRLSRAVITRGEVQEVK